MSDAVNITEEEMPILRPIPFKPREDHRHWRFMEDWVYGKVSQLPERWSTFGQSIFIPKGKVINGASIPKIFTNVFSSTGILFIGACIHDPGYEDAGLNFINSSGDKSFFPLVRSQMDDLFADVSQLHYPEHHTAIELAERNLELFGGGAWDDCRKKDGTYIPPVDHSAAYDKEWNQS